MRQYKCLVENEFVLNEFKIVPIRFEDRLDIMKWRNEQIYHLRQAKPLTLEDQNAYFEHVVSKLFEQEKPQQLLFSFLKDDVCIGYGGLVHINWIDKHAEISFIMNTELEQDYFADIWTSYLKLIEEVAFKDLLFHKIFTYAFDLRPHLYKVLENSNYIKEAELKEHCYFNYEFKSVIIHSKLNSFRMRIASEKDIETTFKWANNPDVRAYSFSKDEIPFSNHSKWFVNKISDPNCIYLILEENKNPIGSIRFDLSDEETLISYLLSPEQHGRGLGTVILNNGIKYLQETQTRKQVITGLVKPENEASVRIFQKLGFNQQILDNSVIKYFKTI